jgi:hypothetical protein
MQAKSLISALLFLIMIDAVSAVGVAHSVADFKNGKLIMQKNQEKSFRFIIQNNDDVSRDVIFKISTIMPFRINGAQSFQQAYYLPAKTNQEVSVTFRAPNFNAEFPVKYGYSVLGSSTGMIRIISETDHVMYVNVGECVSCLWSGIGIPLDYGAFSLMTYDENPRHITDLVLFDKNDTTKVEFLEEVDLYSYSFREDYVNISFNYVRINTDAYPALNKHARITFKGLNYSNTPQILKNGQNCTQSMGCIIDSYYDGVLVFTVANFSTYTTISKDVVTTSSATSSTVSQTPVTGEVPGTNPGDTSSPSTSPVSNPSDTNTPASAQELLKQQQANALAAANNPESAADSELKDGARQLISTMAWGFITLLMSVITLYMYVNNKLGSEQTGVSS